jgi:hypothetical protein
MVFLHGGHLFSHSYLENEENHPTHLGVFLSPTSFKPDASNVTATLSCSSSAVFLHVTPPLYSPV